MSNNSWTDLNITDSLKQACAEVSAKTREDFGQFVRDALDRFGVDDVNQLKPSQKSQLEEHILVNWKGTYDGTEVERLDELSKEKLGQYIKKATSDYADKHIEIEKHLNKAAAAHKEADKAGRRTEYGSMRAYVAKAEDNRAAKKMQVTNRRKRGIDKAVNKLTEEETIKESASEVERLDELSKETLKNYAKKATTKLSRNAYIAGQSSEDPDEVNKRLRNTKNARTGIQRAVDKLTKEETIKEAATPAEIAASDLASKMSLPALQRRLQTALQNHDVVKANIAKIAIKHKQAQNAKIEESKRFNSDSDLYDTIHRTFSEGRNSEGRTDLTFEDDPVKKKKELDDAREDLQKDHNIANQMDETEDQPGMKISKITADNNKPVEGKVTKEPGVVTDAQKTLSPSEKSKLDAMAKKLGLKEGKKLVGDQHKLDVDGDGKIESSDLAKIRNHHKPRK